MRMETAMDIIEKHDNQRQEPGYIVCFTSDFNGVLKSDFFPELGEEAVIETEKEAWVIARKFALASLGEHMKYNIYVARRDTHRPVDSYKDKMFNRIEKKNSEGFMSGGYFNYNQYHIEEIVSDIENVIYENGNPKDGYNFTKQTIDKLEEAIIVLRKAVIMVQGIDWLLEGDDDEETFHSRWEEDLGY